MALGRDHDATKLVCLNIGGTYQQVHWRARLCRRHATRRLAHIQLRFTCALWGSAACYMVGPTALYSEQLVNEPRKLEEIEGTRTIGVICLEHP
eukprot:scaffold118448_cov33-Tisochrysis_lutea.AAC.4